MHFSTFNFRQHKTTVFGIKIFLENEFRVSRSSQVKHPVPYLVHCLRTQFNLRLCGQIKHTESAFFWENPKTDLWSQIIWILHHPKKKHKSETFILFYNRLIIVPLWLYTRQTGTVSNRINARQSVTREYFINHAAFGIAVLWNRLTFLNKHRILSRTGFHLKCCDRKCLTARHLVYSRLGIDMTENPF